jgi:hypothetical protein
MSKSEGKGSILLKLAILILIIVLFFVIVIPGKIWDQEDLEKATAQANIMSVYEGEKFFHRRCNNFTSDPDEIINTIKQDSAILTQKKVVDYTQQLSLQIDSYIKIPYIKSLIAIDKNINNIVRDLLDNRRYFKTDENILNEADNLKLQLGGVLNETEHNNYVVAANYLDTLIQLRRDLSDYSLQMGASHAYTITDTLSSVVGNINTGALENAWLPLSERIAQFVKTINRSELKNQTSVGDRIKDFKEKIDIAFNKFHEISIEKDIEKANGLTAKLAETYQSFLSDFIVTGKRSLYKLSEEDSLVLHLTKENFYSPVTNEMYRIIITDDSTAFKVESPVLLNELREMAAPVVNSISELPILPAFQVYKDTLESIKEKGYAIRKKIRRNTDIFIMYKQVEEIINKFNEISVFSAYTDLTTFMNSVPVTESYSDIKLNTENALNGIRIYHQAYKENFFGNFDSLHIDLVEALGEFNELMSNVRKLPKDVSNFDNDINNINSLQAQIKNIPTESMLNKMKIIEENLGNIFLFASEGKNIKIYGIFNKQIENQGYIYKDSKSWEEEE